MPDPSPTEAALSLLLRHLEERRAGGDEQVWLSPKARKELRQLPALLAATRVQPASRPAPPRASPPPAAAPELPRPAVPPAPAPPAAPVTAPVALPVTSFDPQGATKAEKLRWLEDEAKSFPAILELDSLRPTMVFSTGNPDARLMFVGEAPGAEEERQGEPFIGPAGQLLTKMIVAMGLKREDVYISNICKYRPALPNQGESNRKPTLAEMAACLPFIRAEVDVVRPEAIVALGGTAAQGLLGEEAPVASLRACFHSFAGIPLMVTYHPSYLLRNVALSERRKVWEDLLMVMETLELPISPKQRAFFTS